MRRIFVLCFAIFFCASLISVPSFAAEATVYGTASYPFAEPLTWISVLDGSTPTLYVLYADGNSQTMVSASLASDLLSLTFRVSCLEEYASSIRLYRFRNGSVASIVAVDSSTTNGRSNFTYTVNVVTYNSINFSSTNPGVSFIHSTVGWAIHGVSFDGSMEFGEYLESIGVKIDSLNDSVNSGFSSVGTWFTDLKQSIVDGFNSVTGWFQNLYNKAVSSWDAILEKLDTIITGGEAGEQFKEDASNQAGKLDDAAASLGGVNKPDVSQDDMSLDGILSPSDFQTGAYLVTMLWDFDFISWQLQALVVTLLLSFVLYGKKG